MAVYSPVFSLCRAGEAEGHGSWAAEDSVPAEERQEGSGEEEISWRRPEDCSQGRSGPHLPRLPGESRDGRTADGEVSGASLRFPHVDSQQAASHVCVTLM